MAIDTRRVTPQNASSVRAQFETLDRRVQSDQLRRGDTGPAVEALQARLKSFGALPGPVDGVFGPQTEAAVRDFQAQAGIVVDGRAGPQTLAAMRAKTMFVGDNFEVAATVGQRGRDVFRAERMLKDVGRATGAVDGTFDADTAHAIKAFRAADPSLPDGARMNARTFAALRTKYQESLQTGSETLGVRVLERNLQRLGKNPGTVDTQYTASTAQAVRGFQRENGLTETGVADVNTRQAIQRAVNKLPTPVEETLDRFNTEAPPHDYRRVQVGEPGDSEFASVRTVKMMERAEFIMREKFDHRDFNFTVVQGSYSSGVGASGGTHDGGGALDIRTRDQSRETVNDMVKSLRMAGFAAWSRGRGADSFDPHIHALGIGDRELSSAARGQIDDYFAGRNGLVGNGPDADAFLGRPIPQWARR